MQYWITKVTDHSVIKPKIIETIEQFQISYTKKAGENISKTDYSLARDKERPYIKYLNKLFTEDLKETMNTIGAEFVEIENVWFQQYVEGDTHNWHSHPSCNFTNIYYLEYSKDCPGTELVDPVNKEIVSFDIEEGYVLTFPAFIFHRSPKCGKKRKTVISFNTNATSLYNMAYYDSIRTRTILPAY